MPEFWRRFYTVVTFLAGALAFYILGIQLNAPWLVPVFVLGSLAAAVLVPPLWVRLSRYTKAIVGYPVVVSERNALRAELRRVTGERDKSLGMAGYEHERGWREGVEAVLGQSYGSGLGEMPRLVAASASLVGQFALIAKSNSDQAPLPSTHLALIVEATGETKAVLRVIDVSEDGRSTLICVDARDEAYWAALSGRSADHVEPPEGVVLGPVVGGPRYPGYRDRGIGDRDG